MGRSGPDRGPSGRSGAGRPEGDRQTPADPPEGIGGVVRRLLGDRHMRRGVALGRLARAWPQVVGEQLARQTSPRALDQGGLLVAASSAAWGSQVRFLAPEIRKKANEALGAEEVRTVRVTVSSEARNRLSRNDFGGDPGPSEGRRRGGSGW
jgi:predicted nucleic acid-binding Zn ribbon protein